MQSCMQSCMCLFSDHLIAPHAGLQRAIPHEVKGGRVWRARRVGRRDLHPRQLFPRHGRRDVAAAQAAAAASAAPEVPVQPVVWITTSTRGGFIGDPTVPTVPDVDGLSRALNLNQRGSVRLRGSEGTGKCENAARPRGSVRLRGSEAQGSAR